jgi:hypothetical protein
MTGTITVLTPDEYDAWFAGKTGKATTPAEAIS